MCVCESSWHVQMKKSKRTQMMPCLQRRTSQPVAIRTPRQDNPDRLWNQAKPQAALALLPRPRLAGVPDSVVAVPTQLLSTHLDHEPLRNRPLRTQQLQTRFLKPQPFKAE